MKAIPNYNNTHTLHLQVALFFPWTWPDATNFHFQGSVYDWVLDHRLHHKYHGKDLDKYNFKRGFLFSHMGNRYYSANPASDNLHTQIDMRDLEEDPIVMWQNRYLLKSQQKEEEGSMSLIYFLYFVFHVFAKLAFFGVGTLVEW